MSLDTLVATIEELTIQEIESEDTPVPIALSVVKFNALKKKGRPGVHTKEGRVYFLKEEIEQIRKDPTAFAEWMQETYRIADTRYAELVNNKVNLDSNGLSFTLHGSILEVLSRAEAITEMFADREVLFEISKQRLVAPTSAVYVAPTTKVVEINQKMYTAIVSQEFNPEIIYVYLTIK
jgi:hypothetical protein